MAVSESVLDIRSLRAADAASVSRATAQSAAASLGNAPSQALLLPHCRLPEFSDQDWLPMALRAGELDLLRSHLRAWHVFDALADAVGALAAAYGRPAVIDLGSGAGGPLVDLRDRLGVPLVLTDRRPTPTPELAALEAAGALRYEPGSVDATAMPPHLRGVRTLFNLAHHLPAAVLRGVIADAIHAGEPLVIGEFNDRRLRHVLATAAGAFFLAWQEAWRRPATAPGAGFWSRWLPVVPAIYAIDGSISNLRSWTASELLAIAHAARGDATAHIEAGARPVGVYDLQLTWLVVRP